MVGYQADRQPFLRAAMVGQALRSLPKPFELTGNASLHGIRVAADLEGASAQFTRVQRDAELEV